MAEAELGAALPGTGMEGCLAQEGQVSLGCPAQGRPSSWHRRATPAGNCRCKVAQRPPTSWSWATAPLHTDPSTDARWGLRAGRESGESPRSRCGGGAPELILRDGFAQGHIWEQSWNRNLSLSSIYAFSWALLSTYMPSAAGRAVHQAAPGLCHPVAEWGQRTRGRDQIKGDLIERVINRAEARRA